MYHKTYEIYIYNNNNSNNNNDLYLYSLLLKNKLQQWKYEK